MKLCSRCEAYFLPKVSYQVYCSNICREEATREKIAERYQATKRQKRIGKVRKCKNCGNDLSIYNDEPICTFCLINPVEVVKALKKMRIIINDKE